MTTSARTRSPWRASLGTFRRRKTAVCSLVLLVAVAATAALAPAIAPYQPEAQDLRNRLQSPNWQHLLGTDLYGRDVFSRLMWGARTSLSVGFASILVAATIGTIAGLVSGYFPRIDPIMMRMIDVSMVFPPLVLAIAFVSIIGPGLLNIIVAISLATIPQFARLVRSEAMEVRELTYIEAARATGASHWRIMFQHVLRSTWSTVLVVASLQVSNAILLEATLSFFGLGVAPPTASWGYMISIGRNYLVRAPWLSVFPGVAILLTVLSLNLLGDGLRDALDPYLHGEGGQG